MTLTQSIKIADGVFPAPPAIKAITSYLTPRKSAIRSRFIPTRVGNTTCCTMPASTRTVHPHASGEHYTVDQEKMGIHGSSPREWGTLLV